MLLLVTLIFFRPILHGPLMWVWRAPLPWFGFGLVLFVGWLLSRRAKLTVADLQAGRDPSRGVFTTSLLVAGMVWLLLSAINPLLVQRSMAKNIAYDLIDEPPVTGVVRIVPRDVAVQVSTGGFNSSTERLTDLRIIDTPDQGMQWSGIRTPEGTVRRWSKRSQGLALLDAGNAARRLDLVDAEFKYAPGLQLFDNLSWQLRKKRLLADLADPVGILDEDGRPLIMTPYLTYTGILIRRPKLGGVFVAHPDGRIEDLSPEEASKRPELVQSGRIYPDTLARREHDAFAMRGGIWNFLFLHDEQTQIVDTELNRQPYLMRGPNGGHAWVSVAQPYGQSRATNAVFLTDATSGKTRVWQVPADLSLSGNARAVETVTGLAIPGVTFLRGAQRGGFRAVEPRPVFVKGRLYFLVSVINDQASTTAKTVLIDAETNRSAGVFDSDAAGLESTLAFLRDGPPEGRAESDVVTDPTKGGSSAGGSKDAGDNASATTPPASAGSGSSGSGSGAGSSSTRPSEAELRRRLDEAIDRQSEVLSELRDLQSDLEATR